MKQQLYPWQEECLQTWLANDGRGIIQAVTGAGKTTLAIGAMEKLQLLLGPQLRVKIVVPQTALAVQWAAALRDTGGIPREKIGFYYGGWKEREDRFCMIYVINSARYTLARSILTDLAGGRPVFLIADECHHYASEENRKIFDFLPRLGDFEVPFRAMGLSATPGTAGFREYLVPALGDVIYNYTFEDAARNRTISPFVICNVALSFDPGDADAYDAVTARITSLSRKLQKRCPALKGMEGMIFFRTLQRLAVEDDGKSPTAQLAAQLLLKYRERRTLLYETSTRAEAAVRLISRLGEQERILIFGERIALAEEVYAMLKDCFPGQVGIYHSKMGSTANQAVLQRYRNGEIRILVTCRALDEGLDVPQTSVGIVLSSSSVERQRIQRLGRILRKSPRGGLATLYYFYVGHTVDRYTYMGDFDDPPVRTLFLSYLSEEDQFLHPVYEQLAASLIARLVLEGAGGRVQREVRRCLETGLCRTDWLLDRETLRKAAERAGSLKEKNYWLCMDMLREEDETSRQQERP